MASELKTLIEKRRVIRDDQKALEMEFDEIGKRMAELAEEADASSTVPAPKRRAKKSPPQPDHDGVAKRYADLEPCPTGCLCGCGEDITPGTNFVRGHQKRFNSIAGAVNAGKLDIDKLSTRGVEYARTLGLLVNAEATG